MVNSVLFTAATLAPIAADIAIDSTVSIAVKGTDVIKMKIIRGHND
jgi:hypothetical protein